MHRAFVGLRFCFRLRQLDVLLRQFGLLIAKLLGEFRDLLLQVCDLLLEIRNLSRERALVRILRTAGGPQALNLLLRTLLSLRERSS